MNAAVVRTGTANLASVLAALRRVGVDPVETQDAGAVRDAPLVVLPGVGSFGAAMETLSAHAGLGEALASRARSGRALLAICLGFQVLFESSEESPGVRGLGVLPGSVRRFAGAPGLRVPQMGWNTIEPAAACRSLAGGEVYFANSYRVGEGEWAAPAGWAPAWCAHGDRFVAGVEAAEGRVVACQFHPELSGALGASLLARWVAANREATCSPSA
ncbi:MAG: imidazole glycerol phosphate synthase subunit HisH [Planctomycetota bacterium]